MLFLVTISPRAILPYDGYGKEEGFNRPPYYGKIQEITRISYFSYFFQVVCIPSLIEEWYILVCEFVTVRRAQLCILTSLDQSISKIVFRMTKRTFKTAALAWAC